MVHAHDESTEKTTPAARSVRPTGTTADGIAALQRTIGNAAVSDLFEQESSTVHSVLAESGRALDEPLRHEMEARLGADFSDVRLHTGSAAQRSAQGIGARAYTSGNHVVIGEGGADMHTLAHELTHVIQQRHGPVDGTPQADGLSISDPSDKFEQEAERNAVRAMRRAPDLQRSTGPAHAPAGHIVQRFTEGTFARKEGRLSQNGMYLLPTKKRAEIWVREDLEPPRYCQPVLDARKVKHDGTSYYKCEPKTIFPKDCLRAAEEIMHQKALAQGQMASAVRGSNAPFSATEERQDNVALANAYATARGTNATGVDPNDLEAPDVGQAYAIVETEYQEGKPVNSEEYPYHAAAVVAVDGNDRITLEALATSIDAEELEPGPGSFYIYETDPAVAPPQGMRSFRSEWGRYFSSNAITITLVPYGENLAEENRAR
jgi:hypothetical protein